MSAAVETYRKYLRIQRFYKELRKHECFTHSFCESLICRFFHIQTGSTVSRILAEEIPQGIDFDESDLDNVWIMEYIKKHLKIKEDEKIKS
jgi:hypothetical protein